MNTLNLTLVIILIFSFGLLNAQDNDHHHDNNHNHGNSQSKFSLVGYGGIGYAVVNNDNQPNYNLNASTVDLLVYYQIGKRYGIATGVGVNQLSGNGFSSAGNFYHERGTLKIPVLLSINYNLSEKVRLLANIGLYGQTIVRDEYSFVGGTIDDLYEGWNFGFQSAIGLAYNFNQQISFGIMFNNQGDLSRIDSDSNKGINDEQKISGINTVGLMFGINF